MRALVVYESMFGNTQQIALAIAEGIASRLPVETLEIGQAPSALPADVGLLVVGGPTHAHGMSTDETRADAARRAGTRLVSRGMGLREWLARLGPGSTPVAAAVFDTRIKGPGILWGSAAKTAAQLLQQNGFRLVQPPQDFLVGGPTGPLFDRLIEGELDRARAWGASLTGGIPAAASRA